MKNDPSHFQVKPYLGYIYAGLNAVISGFAIFINTYGVKIFSDSTLYTTLKNGVTGVLLAIPFLLIASQRAELKQLSKRQWGLLLLLAVIGGSVPYALTFRGFQLIGSPVTNTILSRTQFLFVALFAVFAIKERISAMTGVAVLTLLVGVLWGLNLHQFVMNQGAILIVLATVLYAITTVLMKYLLRELSPMMVMVAKMSIGSLMLVAYVATTGHISAIASLSAAQWSYTIGTGVILLLFTVTSVLSLRHISAVASTAIPSASPLVTASLVMISSGSLALPKTLNGTGSIIILAAIGMFVVMGLLNRQHAQQKVMM